MSDEIKGSGDMGTLKENLLSIFQENCMPPAAADEADMVDLGQALCMSIMAWIRHPEQFPELQVEFMGDLAVMAVIMAYLKSAYGIGLKRGENA